MVSRARLRQPSGRPADVARGGVPPDRWTSPTRRSSSSRDAKAVAPEKPFFLYYAPGACHAPHHAPKEWIDRYKGRFDMGYEAMREQTLARQKELGIVPADTELPPINPIGTPETRTGPDGQPFPPTGRHPAVGLALGRGEAAVRADGGGVRGVPRARRPPDRPAARLPRGDRAAGEHAGHRWSPTTARQRRGRPERLGERDEVHQRHPRRHRGQPADARRPRRPEDLQPLSERLGDGVQHAVQDVEALRVQRRHLRPVHHLLAGRHEGARRDPRPVPPRGRHRPDRPGRRSASSRRTRSRATPRATSTASACATASTTPRRRRTRADAVLLDARLAGDLARRLEGRHHPPDRQRLGQLQRRRVGALPHRRRPIRAAQPRRRAARTRCGSW